MFCLWMLFLYSDTLVVEAMVVEGFVAVSVLSVLLPLFSYGRVKVAKFKIGQSDFTDWMAFPPSNLNDKIRPDPGALSANA